MRRSVSLLSLFVFSLVSNPAAAEETDPPAAPLFTVAGYAEVYYQWNFGQPEDGATAFRGYDNRHNSFTVENAVFGASWDAANVVGRLAIQVGHAPVVYYGGEPTIAASPGANASDDGLWRYLQEAKVGYRFDVLSGLVIDGGLFLSPIGLESIMSKDNWAFSRSNLFFALPSYHTGARAALAVTPEWTVTLGVTNGWNSVVDNNDQKSFWLQANHTKGPLSLALIYLTGVERSEGAAEGQGWRHTLDANATVQITPEFAAQFHVDGGLESTDFGLSSWAGGVLGFRYAVLPWMFVSARGDFFWESPAEEGANKAGALFFPVEWVSSGTLTVDFRPADTLSLRVEYRHDHASGNLYLNEAAGPTAEFQDTLTLGATAWF